MMMIALTGIFVMALSVLVMTIASLLAKKPILDREKASPFECGFDPMNTPRLPFSLHFFLIAVIFLIFDVEITLLIPFVQTMKISSVLGYALTALVFIIILLLGTYHEWNQGALSWID